MDSPRNEKSTKILVLFLFIVIALFLFIVRMANTAIDMRTLPAKVKVEEERAKRGAILSSDGFRIAVTQKLYKAIINTRNLDPNKKELFIELFSIYTSIPTKELRQKINSTQGSVTLSYTISEKDAKQLRSLGHQLLKLKVFKRYVTADGRVVVQGLDVLESGASRSYPYGDLLTPIIGYIHKTEEDGYTQVAGVKGIEKSYETILEQKVDGRRIGERDVNNYLILNKASKTQVTQHGVDVILNIPVALQRRAEFIADTFKEKLGAQEVMFAIMESHTGKIVALGSSNRFLPKSILRSDYPSLNANVAEYLFEPGSIIKPLLLARLLESKKVSPYDIVNTYNGRYQLGRKLITDEHKAAYMSAENVIVNSSNIGIVQLGQQLGAIEFYQGLADFGLGQSSGIDLPYERFGSLPDVTQLNNSVVKAVASYGYGLNVTFIQMLRAYNAFNNNGEMVTPTLVSSIRHQGKLQMLSSIPPQVALESATANRMKQILVKTVQEGTGIGTRIEGLEIGGKTGTAHIVEAGKYVNAYNSSFFGFVNDASHHYTIGVTVIRPNKHTYFAATSAVPTFKAMVELMVEMEYLKPQKL
ncbi:MAG: hypothetical protein KU37_02890 [Sulfuricurvum sp. PC08-66]|nr:MAG: hypothetical protein KU37_02890 [Sulfuricurvum sp. PC08-66]